MQRFSVSFASFCLLVLVAVAPSSAQPLELNHTYNLEHAGAEAAAPFAITLEVPAAGWLAVEVTSPGEGLEETFPWLDVSSWVRSVHRQSARQLFEVPAPGSYQFHLGSVRGEGSYRWSSILLPSADLTKDGDDGDGTEEPDNQVQPILTRWSDVCPILAPVTGPIRLASIPQKDGDDGDGTEEPDNQVQPYSALPQPDGDDGDGTEEPDNQVQPYSNRNLCRIDWAFRSLAMQTPQKDGGDGDGTEEPDNQVQPYSALPQKDGDDGDGTEEPDNQVQPILFGGFDCAAGLEPANNLSLCAAALHAGAEVNASLREQGFGVDQDYFVFDLRKATRVEVTSTGSTDTFGILYDAHGHRLLADDDSGEDGNFALAATLAPGRYFVRVEEGGGGGGAYGLRLNGATP
jgi:hypothetical protein